MTVYINGRFLTQRQTGVQRYALETLQALDSIIDESPALQRLDVVVLAPKGTASPNLRRIGFRTVGPLTGHVWEQLTLPLFCGPSLLLSFATTGPLLKSHQAVTMHDAAVFAVPQTYSRAFRTWYRLVLPVLARRAHHLVTVSKFSRDELVRYLGSSATRAVVSGEGWEHVMRPAADPTVLARHGLEPRRYLLVVGSLSPHKNLGVVIRAARALTNELDVNVAIAGPVDPAVFSTSEQRVDSNIKLLGYVSEGELRSLYENAAAFIHPSKYEGFGIPPIEAMALDCPVIASCAAAIPEVCGDAARYFSPDDAEALADIIRAVVNCPEDRETLIARGREQIQRHTWRASARCYLSIIERQPAAASSTTIDAPPSRAAQLAPMLHSPTAQASAPSDKNYANLD